MGGRYGQNPNSIDRNESEDTKKAAMDEGTSVADIIRRAVENMVQTTPKVNSPERVRRTVEIVGKFRSGKRNVFRKHEENLTKAYRK